MSKIRGLMFVAAAALLVVARPMRRTRVRSCLAIFVAAIPMVVVALVGLPATASVMAVPSTSPPQGYTTLDRHGCPIYHESSGTKVAAFGNGGPTTTFLKRGEHCVALPASVFTLAKSSKGGCDQLTIVQVAYPKGIGPVAAVVYSTIGEGTRWWEQPVNSITGTGPGTGPGKTTGFGDISYRVPKGYYAWQVGGGGGAAPCGPPPKLDGWAAWGITAKYPIRGVVTLGCKSSCTPDEGLPVANVNVSVDGPTKATATTDDRGQYLVLVGKGSYRVTPELTGWRFDPHHRSVGVKTSADKHLDFTACGAGASSASGALAKATGTWKFTGTGCLSTVKVTYTPKSGEMTVGWYANAAICDNPPGPTIVHSIGGPEIADGTSVPANLITKTPTHITAKVLSTEGVREMDVELRANGSSGTADLYSAAFAETITSGPWEGHSCRPGSGSLNLTR
jgi:hypothetical protein